MPLSMRSAKASSDARVMMSAISRKVDTVIPELRTLPTRHFYGVGARGQLRYQRRAFPLAVAVRLGQFANRGAGDANATDVYPFTGV